MEKVKMRRTKQEIALEECEEVLRQGSYGVLSLATKQGEPYGVPVNYAYADGKIIIHGAKKGLRNELADENRRASFCVVDQSDVVQEELATTYRSVIVQGKIAIVEDREEMRDLLRKMNAQLAPDLSHEASEKGIEVDLPYVLMTVIEPDYITGKISLNMLQARKKKK